MPSRQRAVVVSLGAVVCILAVVLIIVAVDGKGGRSKLAVTSSTIDAAPSTAPTSTTVELLPVIPSTAPTSVLATTTTSSTVATTTSMVAPLVNGSGAVLSSPGSIDQRPQGASCASLADPGWGAVRCGVAHAQGASLTWLTESRAGPRSGLATRSYVFEPVGVKEQVVLEAFDDDASRFTGVHVKVDTVEGGGFEDIVFGFRNQGSAEILSIDLVQGPGEVAVHQDLYKGVARTAPGRLDLWSAVLGANDPNCCPSSYEHETISYSEGGWRVVDAESVAPSAVPPSEL